MIKSPSSFPGGSDGKESACNAGDLSSIPGLGRSPGEGNGNPLQYSCLENPKDRGTWQGTGHGVVKSIFDAAKEESFIGGFKIIFLCIYGPYACVCAQSLQSRVRLFSTLWTIARQAPLSLGFSREEYWSELPRPPPGDLPNPGIEPTSLNISGTGRRVLYH